MALDSCSLADRPRAAPSRGIRSTGGLTLSLHPARASPVLRDGASLTTDSSHRSAPERAAILRAPSTRSGSDSCIRIVKRYRHSPYTSRARWAPLVRVPLFQGPTLRITPLGSRSSRSRFRWSPSRITPSQSPSCAPRDGAVRGVRDTGTWLSGDDRCDPCELTSLPLPFIGCERQSRSAGHTARGGNC